MRKNSSLASFFSPDEVPLDLSPGVASRQSSLEHLTRDIFGPSAYPKLTNNDFQFKAPSDNPFTTAGLNIGFNNFNVNKTPGSGSINFRILKFTFKIIPQIFIYWTNLCLIHQCFPLFLRQCEMVCFLKLWKLPSKLSYRPICLSTTLVKLLEKLLVFRLNHFLKSNNLLHPRQFGFREGRSKKYCIQY